MCLRACREGCALALKEAYFKDNGFAGEIRKVYGGAIAIAGAGFGSFAETRGLDRLPRPDSQREPLWSYLQRSSLLSILPRASSQAVKGGAPIVLSYRS